MNLVDLDAFPISVLLGRRADVQREPSAGANKGTPTDCQEAAIGHGRHRWSEWRLYVVLRSVSSGEAPGAVLPPAYLTPGMELATQYGRSLFRYE